jgi:hypothetical protein
MISMKKISIAFLAAMSLASFGCKKGGAGQAIAKMGEFKDKMCACKDKACTEKVTEEMTKWGQEQAKGGDKDAKVSEEDTKKMAAVTEEMTKCMTKIMTDAAGAPGGAPPAGGTPPAGGGGQSGTILGLSISPSSVTGASFSRAPPPRRAGSTPCISSRRPACRPP